jgi:hypothetical protein
VDYLYRENRTFPHDLSGIAGGDHADKLRQLAARLEHIAAPSIQGCQAQTLFAEPYLSTDPAHEGLILHSVYHRPNGWDHIPPGQSVPCGESSMWGDYHARELAVQIHRIAHGNPDLQFFAINFGSR